MVKIMEIRLPHYGRGYHLITQELLSRLPQLPENGLLNLFIKHTSAALTINENADPDVRLDFAAFFDRIVPDGASYFKHIYEGDDDMSAHIKASLLGASLTIPIRGRALDLGTWQGIYLCEFRNGGGKDLETPVCTRKEGNPPQQTMDFEELEKKNAANNSSDFDETFYGDETFDPSELDEEGFADLNMDDEYNNM